MNPRTRLLTLSVVLVLLVGAYVAGSLTYRPGQADEAVEAAFPAIENPETIELISPQTEDTVLRQTEAGWVVDEGELRYPARESRVLQLVDSLLEAEIGRRVSGSEDALDALGLTDGTAYTIRAEEDGRAVEGLVGDSGSTPQTAYFRYPASTEARLLHGGLRFYLTQRPAYWADLRVFFGRFEDSAVVRVDIDYGNDEPTTLFREGEGWSITPVDSNPDNSDADGETDAATGNAPAADKPDASGAAEGEADDARVDRLARTATTFEAGRFVAYRPDIEWERTLRLHLDDGRVFSLYAAGEEDEVRLMAGGPGLPTDENGLPYQYVAGRASVDRLFPQRAALLSQ